MKNVAWICSWILALAACDQSHQLGSDCPSGVCPRALGRAAPACLVREDSRLLMVQYAEPGTPDAEAPVDPDVYFGGGWVEYGTRRVFWAFEADVTLSSGETLLACDQLPFLTAPEPDDEGAKLLRLSIEQRRERNGLVCLVQEAMRTSEGEFVRDGWYFDVASPSGTQVLRYSPGVGPVPNRVLIWATSVGAESIARDGTLKETDPGICSLPEDSANHDSDVGRSCSPSSSAVGAYDESEVVVETGSTQCATGACLVYQLEGDPKKPCGKRSADFSCRRAINKPFAAAEDEIARRVYCSCRCDAPAGDPGELCACKSGFSCVPTLFHAPPGVRGSYCVKDGTISQSLGL